MMRSNSRVFPIHEWAPAQESRTPMTTASSDPEMSATERNSPALPVRKRLQSLPLVGRDFDISGGVRNLSFGTDEPSADTKKVGGIRGFLRKASISIKSRQRRHSLVVEERPETPTTWRRLKTAASFHRHSKFLSMGGDFESTRGFIAQDGMTTPSGTYTGNAPFIPQGGHAARVAAAQQNEYFGRSRPLHLSSEQLEDRESGIGIAVNNTYSNPPELCNDSDMTNDISRKDFISILPAELAIQVLTHLDQESLRRVPLVCWQWNLISQTQSIWKEVLLRDQTKTYATGRQLALGAGLGLPAARTGTDWKDIYRIREQLKRNWLGGQAEAVYLNGHMDSIYCVQFDENKIITGSRDKTIRIWNMHNYHCKLVIGPPEVVNGYGILCGEDGRPAHYATREGYNRSEGSESLPLTVSFPTHHSQSILCLQYDDRILVTGSSDSSCIIHDITQGYKPIRRLRHHTAAVLDLAFDDRHIVTCSKDISICIWDRETGAMLKQLRGHAGPVNAVQLRGNTIVSCSGDFKVKLWNVDTGRNIKELAGHTKGLACSQFSDDSRFIASAGNDRIIRIWDANTGDCLKEVIAHDNLVRSLHIDSVSGRLISGSYDQDIKVFDMATGSLLLDFPKWHSSWVLGAKSDYRRIISTGQDPKILVMDFGANIKGIENLES